MPSPSPAHAFRQSAPESPPGDRLETATELAHRWGVSRAHVYNQMKRGLPSVKVGAARRFWSSQADAWLNRSQDAA